MIKEWNLFKFLNWVVPRDLVPLWARSFYQKERIAVSYHLSTVGKEYANQRYFELRENQIPNAWQFACS